MTLQTPFPVNLQPAYLGRRALLGAVAGIFLFALMIMYLLLFGSGDFQIRGYMAVPLGTVAFGCALGGIFISLFDYIRSLGGWKKIAINVFCGLAFLVVYWLSLVYGLSLVGVWD